MKSLKDRIAELKSKIGNLLATGALAAAACFPFVAHAGQPVVYSLVITNAVDAAVVGLTNQVTFQLTNKWSNGTSTYGYVDTFQAANVAIEASSVSTVNGAGGYTSATNVLNTIVSPDLVAWMPGPQVFWTVGNSNSWQGNWTNADARSWRYIIATNMICGATNSCISNANLRIRIVLKGP